MIDEPQMAPDDGGAPMDAAPEQAQPDGGNPEQMIGYIPEEYPAKEKTYLAAAKSVLLNEQTAGMLKQMLSQGNDPTMTLAALIGKTVDAIETKLGPLTDDEHDRVCLVISGWLASTLQQMGMPGMDDAGARQDFMGRVMQQLDSMTQGEGGEQAPTGQQQAPPPDAQQPPMGQFGGA